MKQYLDYVPMIAQYVLPLLACILAFLRRLRVIRRRRTYVIGVVGETIPDGLKRLPIYLDLNAALREDHNVVVVLYKRLSKALRRADIVCANADSDPKIYKPDSAIWNDIYNIRSFAIEPLSNSK